MVVGPILKCCFKLVPALPHEELKEEGRNSGKPIGEYGGRLVKAFRKVFWFLLVVVIWMVANDVIYGMTRRSLGPGLFIEVISSIGAIMQVVQSSSFVRKAQARKLTIRDVQVLRVLLQVMMLVRVSQLMPELATLNLECTLAEGAFARLIGNTTLDREVRCHALFGLENSFSVVAYVCVTIIQGELLARMEKSWSDVARKTLADMAAAGGALAGDELKEVKVAVAATE